jgi:hypothetical protein
MKQNAVWLSAGLSLAARPLPPSISCTTYQTFSDLIASNPTPGGIQKNRIELPAKLPHNIRMLAKVCSAAVNGIEAFPIEVEVNGGWGDTKIMTVKPQ